MECICSIYLFMLYLTQCYFYGQNVYTCKLSSPHVLFFFVCKKPLDKILIVYYKIFFTAGCIFYFYFLKLELLYRKMGLKINGYNIFLLILPILHYIDSLLIKFKKS